MPASDLRSDEVDQPSTKESIRVDRVNCQHASEYAANSMPMCSPFLTESVANVELYGTGLGPVSYVPEDGAPASLTQLSAAKIPVTVTVGGLPAQVLFAGLAPGTVGLYQINVQIPADAPTGDAVEVIVTQNNVSSRPVTIAVK